MKLRNFVRSFLALLLALTISLSTEASPATAAANVNVYFIADGVQHTKFVYFRDFNVWSGCKDKSVHGAMEFTYVANSTSFTIKKIRFYEATTMKVPMKIEWMKYVASGTATEDGPPNVSPNPISPGQYATLRYWTGGNWQSPSSNFGSSQASVEIRKNDPSGGTLLCNGVWLMGFFKA